MGVDFSRLAILAFSTRLRIIVEGNSYSACGVFTHHYHVSAGFTDCYYPIAIHPPLAPPIKGGEYKMKRFVWSNY
jgi:hypothetical protein